MATIDNQCKVLSKGHQLVLTSTRLSKLVLPQTPTSPYEILVQEVTLILHDPQGQWVTHKRVQWIRCLQDGVAAVLDHAWGDGRILADYHHDAGRVIEKIRDGRQCYLVVGLKRPLAAGEIIPIQVSRQVVGGFTKREEWLETAVDHPIRRLKCAVVLPRVRPCQQARLQTEGWELELFPRTLPSGELVVGFDAEKATALTPFTVHWSW